MYSVVPEFERVIVVGPEYKQPLRAAMLASALSDEGRGIRAGWRAPHVVDRVNEETVRVMGGNRLRVGVRAEVRLPVDIDRVVRVNGTVEDVMGSEVHRRAIRAVEVPRLGDVRALVVIVPVVGAVLGLPGRWHGGLVVAPEEVGEKP